MSGSLIQRLKDDLGLQENFTYLSSLDEAVVARVRQVISRATSQVEELRVGDNVKRRRRVAPVPRWPRRSRRRRSKLHRRRLPKEAAVKTAQTQRDGPG